MDQCDSKINLVKYMWVSDLFFMVIDFALYHCHRQIIFIHYEMVPAGGIGVPLGTCSGYLRFWEATCAITFGKR